MTSAAKMPAKTAATTLTQCQPHKVNSVPLPKTRINTSMHGGVYKTLAIVNIAILAICWWTFRGDGGAVFMIAISAIYLAAYLGTPFIMNRVAPIDAPIDAPRSEPFALFLDKPFETWTGIISGKEALFQVLLIPGAILITLTGISVIIASVN